MTDAFEDHCWRDVVTSDVLELYSHYQRETFVGDNPALLAIDLFEMAYQGGSRPVSEVSKLYPSSCGAFAWTAIELTKHLFAAARGAGVPVIYTRADARSESRPAAIPATNRRGMPLDPELFSIRSDFKPHPGDIVIDKQRASGFFGTPLTAHLTQLGVRSLIVCGQSTSGCVRASTVDGFSHGYHMVMVEECCFDRSEISHKINLFDLHHKYADVMKADAVITHLAGLRPKKV